MYTTRVGLYIFSLLYYSLYTLFICKLANSLNCAVHIARRPENVEEQQSKNCCVYKRNKRVIITTLDVVPIVKRIL